MAWELTDILRAVDDTEASRHKMRAQMDAYQKAWELDFWDAETIAMAREKGWRLYTSPEPRNVVGMAISLLNGKLKVNCPPTGPSGEHQRDALIRARFLELIIEKQSQVHDMSLLEELAWYGAVPGRPVLQVAYIWDDLSDEQKKFMPPILYRALDPRECGFKRDAYGTQWAYHKYSEKLSSAKSKYASYFKDKGEGVVIADNPEDSTSGVDVEVIHFWYVEKGKVFTTTLIDREFAKKPRQSIFPKIPIFERNNDPAPTKDERWRSSSVLEGMLKTWGELNYLHSMHITAVGKKFFPPLFLSNDENVAKPVIDTGPDAVNMLPQGVRPLPPGSDRPDISLVTSAIEAFAEYQQKATFPNSIYGETGAQRAAYGAHMMMSTAARRVQPLKNQIELLLQEANELALFMLAKFSPDEIKLYAFNRATNEGEEVAISSDVIGERYENTVTIEVVVPGAEVQNANIAIQFNQAGLLSSETTRRVGAPKEWLIPEDENLRILQEDIEKDERVRDSIINDVYKTRTGKDLPPKEPPPPPPPQVPPVGRPMGPMQGGNMNPMMGSPEFQGLQNPEMMGLEAMDPQTQMLMAMQNGAAPGPAAMNQMMNGTYRRR